MRAAIVRPREGWVHLALAVRRPLIVFVHLILVVASYALASLLRFEFSIAESFDRAFWRTLPVVVLVRLVVLGLFGLYRGLWRYVSTSDLYSILVATSTGSVAIAAVEFFVKTGAPRSVLIIDWFLCLSFLVGVRVAIRGLRELRPSRKDDTATLRALVVGAGDGAERFIRQALHSDALRYRLVGMVDDNPRKRRTKIHGISVIGALRDLPHLAAKHRAGVIVIAVPSATAEQHRAIMQISRECGLPVKSVPSLRNLDKGRGIGQLIDVAPEDLLDRQAIRVEVDRLTNDIHGSRVLVTGAGGSIGSELCRQIAKLEPRKLIMFERSESPLHFTHVELVERHTGVGFVPVVGDINDGDKVREVMRKYSPDFVYHAAAYKHVPLMETHPLDAIANNVFGTETVARAAIDHNVKKFVLISTDKAVQPVSTMGMTKRVAEDLLQTLGGNATAFVSVRFGNVLGSAGSVLPLFQWQIAKGGPVTVTDPEATRYFMLISEAAQLVLQAGAMGTGGEVFFLDMGSPMRIQRLAEDVIRMSGMSPGKDMPVSTVGLRAGERLNEELVRETEQFLASDHEMVHKVQGIEVDPGLFSEALEVLRRMTEQRDAHAALGLLREMAGAKSS
jgi:FlaA1/EpsC-like NDP-sugar epimerase